MHTNLFPSQQPFADEIERLLEKHNSITCPKIPLGLGRFYIIKAVVNNHPDKTFGIVVSKIWETSCKLMFSDTPNARINKVNTDYIINCSE